MKIVSLNLQSDSINEYLTERIKALSSYADVFCFQANTDSKDWQHTLATILPDFRLSCDPSDNCEKEHNDAGLLMLVREGIVIMEHGGLFVCRSMDKDGHVVFANNLQFAFLRRGSKRCIVSNLRILRNTGEDSDAEDAKYQLKNAKEFLEDMAAETVVLCGDADLGR